MLTGFSVFRHHRLRVTQAVTLKPKPPKLTLILTLFSAEKRHFPSGTVPSKQTVTGSNPVALTNGKPSPTLGLPFFSTSAEIVKSNINSNINFSAMKKRQQKTELRNGCSRTQVYFSPANFLSLRSNTDLEKDWFVECRFHDPEHTEKYPNGFQFRKRVNGFPTLSERKAAMKIYKEEVERMLDEMHYNPITKIFMKSDGTNLSPYMDANTALEVARLKITGSDHHLKQIRCAVARITNAFSALGYSYINISEIRLHHIKNALEYLNLPPYSFNKFRQYLSDVFLQLIEYGATDQNPCRDIMKKKIVGKVPREVLSDFDLAKIDPYLREHLPEFYRYRMIFGMSGGRSAELFRVQRFHVRLDKQEYTVQIQKGRSYVWETKVILLDALPFWTELLAEGNPNDPDEYIFSTGLIPGPKQINSAQITRRWRRHAKKKFGITADFYTLKHRFIDKLDQLEDGTAQIFANHKSDKMTGVYATGRTSRKNDKLKTLRVI